ncbi:MAG: YvrJ family protein [Clostridium sp.]|nr:YvrJ family protein [Clostridium sp.]
MDISELVELITNVGFPMAISTYLLIRLEKQLHSLSSSINKLNTIISVKLGALIEDES